MPGGVAVNSADVRLLRHVTIVLMITIACFIVANVTAMLAIGDLKSRVSALEQKIKEITK